VHVGPNSIVQLLTFSKRTDPSNARADIEHLLQFFINNCTLIPSSDDDDDDDDDNDNDDKNDDDNDIVSFDLSIIVYEPGTTIFKGFDISLSFIDNDDDDDNNDDDDEVLVLSLSLFLLRDAKLNFFFGLIFASVSLMALFSFSISS